MTNFLEHLARENDSFRAVSRWVASLKEKGLIVKASTLPQLIGFGSEISPTLSAIVAPDYSDAEDVLGDIYIGGLSINCEPLKREPYVRAAHLDSDKTLIALRDKGLVKSSNSFREAVQYLSQLRQYGVNVVPGTWEEVLAEEHRQAIDTPLKEIELCAASGRLITRCNPGWSDVHTQNARYRLRGEWNDNPLLAGLIELYHEEGRFRFTDKVCDACHQFRMRELDDIKLD
jgi:hypothetical protein